MGRTCFTSLYQVTFQVFLSLNILETQSSVVSSRTSLTSLGEDAYSALVGHPSSDSLTIEIPYDVYFFFHQLVLPPTFSCLVKTESELLDQLRLTQEKVCWW